MTYYVQYRFAGTEEWCDDQSSPSKSFKTRLAAETWAAEIADENDNCDLRVIDSNGVVLWKLDAGFLRTPERD